MILTGDIVRQRLARDGAEGPVLEVQRVLALVWMRGEAIWCAKGSLEIMGRSHVVRDARFLPHSGNATEVYRAPSVPPTNPNENGGFDACKERQYHLMSISVAQTATELYANRVRVTFFRADKRASLFRQPIEKSRSTRFFSLAFAPSLFCVLERLVRDEDLKAPLFVVSRAEMLRAVAVRPPSRALDSIARGSGELRPGVEELGALRRLPIAEKDEPVAVEKPPHHRETYPPSAGSYLLGRAA